MPRTNHQPSPGSPITRMRWIGQGISAVMLLAVIGVGCTGERPVLTPQAGPAQPAASDPEVIAVADLLAASPVAFTATYSVSPTAADVDQVAATVVREGGRQHVTVGDVDIYVTDDAGVSCVSSQTSCEREVNDGYLSNLNITHEFWGLASQRRLLTDDARKIGAPVGSTQRIANIDAQCVELPLAGPTESGTVTYCATTTGVLARYVGADVSIELTSYSDQIDPQSFEPPPLG